MSFMFPRIVAGIFLGSHGAVWNVFLTCCVLLIGTIGISTWSRWISNVQHHPPAPGQHGPKLGGRVNDTSEGSDISSGGKDNDKSTPPRAVYPLQILVDDANATIE